YKGITSLLGKKNNSEALFYLHRGSEISRDINIYNILSMNAIGILYELEDDIEKAKVYYDKSLQLLSEFKLDYPLEQCRIYYNTAKFYSLIKDYAKSIELSDKGIEINRTHSSIYSLDCLLYEKAFNKQMLGLDAVEDYRIAYYFTRFFENKKLLTYIEKDMQEFNISFK
ncbi:Cro/Cl family transcriptional regulator, partial [Enterococcus faecalis]|nr:Cro/Cl family transcriptional regulator [Enterococcus faecalis]NRE00406.1 Cro/Cl family transcriptional regulator [Enterococcus faecalis]